MTRRSIEQIEVDSIPAGWGIDGLMAQRFLGWVRGNPVTAVPYTFWWTDPDGKTICGGLPKLSEDLNETMKLVEALHKIGWTFGLTQTSTDVVAMFTPQSEDGYDHTRAIKARVPSVHLSALAICRAALLVSQAIEEDRRIHVAATITDEQLN